MGMRFDLKTANWLAYVIDPTAVPPQLESSSLERETLRLFLHRLRERFYSSPWREHELHDLVSHALDDLNRWHGDGPLPPGLLGALRNHFAQRGWTALLVPSGRNRDVDRDLSSEKFLRYLVQIRAEDPGLLLQIEEPPPDVFSLTDVFPAFQTALSHSTEWPGILLWTVRGDSSFLPLPSSSRQQLEDAARWVFSHLATTVGLDIELFTTQYLSEFKRVPRSSAKKLQLLQVSDIHIGCPEASKRLPRVQQLIRNLVEDLGEDSRIVPIVSGDLMDSPDDTNLDSVRTFLDFLANIGTEAPLVVLGNHDVRKDGYLGESLRQAIRLPANNGRVVWLEDEKVGLVCLNSVTGGRLARGMIGEDQLLDVGSEIDRNRRWREYSLISVLHHHPTPVSRPDWYVQPFYERVLGRSFEATDALEDASAFLEFVESRSVAAVLHGHKHIPRVDKTPATGIPILGCGSTVGKVPTADGRPYMSINVM